MVHAEIQNCTMKQIKLEQAGVLEHCPCEGHYQIPNTQSVGVQCIELHFYHYRINK